MMGCKSNWASGARIRRDARRLRRSTIRAPWLWCRCEAADLQLGKWVDFEPIAIGPGPRANRAGSGRFASKSSPFEPVAPVPRSERVEMVGRAVDRRTHLKDVGSVLHLCTCGCCGIVGGGHTHLTCVGLSSGREALLLARREARRELNALWIHPGSRWLCETPFLSDLDEAARRQPELGTDPW